MAQESQRSDCVKTSTSLFSKIVKIIYDKNFQRKSSSTVFAYFLRLKIARCYCVISKNCD